MFWIGAAAGYFLGFAVAWILMNAIRTWDRQDQHCLREGQGAFGAAPLDPALGGLNMVSRPAT